MLKTYRSGPVSGESLAPLGLDEWEEVDYTSTMSESVYNVVELIGTSAESWEKATANAVNEAAKTLRDLRVARVTEQDVIIDDGQIVVFRSKVRLSFKHESLEFE